MTLSDTVEISSDAMARRVGDEFVILDLASGNYFGLDLVGSRIWQLISEGVSLVAIRDVLLAEYEVAREQAEADLIRILEELSSRGLIRVR